MRGLRAASIALLLVVPLFLSVPSLARAEPVVTDDSSIRAQTIGSRDLPGYAALSNHATELGDVLPGRGLYYDAIRDGRVLSGYGRSFQSYSGTAQIHIDMFEYSNARLASGLQRAWDQRENARPLPGGFIVLSSFDGDTYEVRTVVTRGRVSSEVRLTQGRGRNAPAVDTAAVDRELAAVATLQRDRLVEAPDVAPSGPVDLTHLHFYLLALLLAYVLVGQVLIGVIVSLSDRVLYEGIFRRLGRSVPAPDPVSFDTPDLSADVARRTRRYRVGVLLRSAAAAVVITVAYEVPLGVLGSLAALAAGAVVLSVVQMLVSRRRASGSDRHTYSRLAVVTTIAATTLSVVVAGCGALLIFIVAMSRLAVPGDVTPREASHVQVLFVLLGALLFLASDLPLRLGRRLLARQANRLLANDTRAEILLLRSFTEDRRRVRARRVGGRPFVEGLSLRRWEGFEELLAWSLWTRGPVVTVGEPGTRLPPLGASRVYYGDDDWQEGVRARMRAAQLVVLLLGRGPALVWEVQQLREQGLLHKALFVLPPVWGREARSRLAVLNSALDLPPDTLTSLDEGRDRLLAMTVEPNGGLVCWRHRARTDLAYDVATEAAIDRIVSEGASRVHEALPWLRRVQTDIAHLLVRSPSRRAARRTRTRRILLVAPWIAHIATVALFAILIVEPDPVPPLPGVVVGGSVSVGSIDGPGSDDLVGIGWSGQSLIAFGDGHRPQVGYKFDGFAHQVVRDAGEAFVSQSSPYSVVALSRAGTGPGYTRAWTTEFAGMPWDLLIVGDRLVVALPAENSVAVLDRRTGQVLRLTGVPGGPSQLALARGRVIVGSETTSSLALLDADLTRVEDTRASPIAPTSIEVSGDRVYVASILDSAVAVFDADTLEPLQVSVVAATNAVLAVGPDTVVVGTSERTPRLILLDPTNLAVLGFRPLPSQIADLLDTPAGLVGSLPDTKTVTSVV